MRTGPDLRFGYVDVAAANDGVYALFSGRTRECFERDAVFGRFIHVFSWAGRYERVLSTDADLLNITLDASGNTLGQAVCVYRPGWVVGYRRRVAATMDYLPYYDAYQMVATVRLAFAPFDTTVASVLYNITV